MDKPTSKYVSPRGAAMYPYLNKPDDYQGKLSYKTGLRLKPAEDPEHAKFIEKVEEMRAEAHKWAIEDMEAALAAEKKGAKKAELKKKLEEVKMADGPIRPIYDDDGNETGEFRAQFKMNATRKNKDGDEVVMKPTVVDAKGQPIPKKLTVGGGSILRVAGNMVAYYMASSNTTGVTLYMDAVKVLKLSQGNGGGTTAFGGEDDDFEADDLSEFAGTEGDDEAPKGANAKGPDDFAEEDDIPF